MSYVRPLWKFTALMLPLFLGCVVLGMWQLERLQWKLALIANVDQRTVAKPVSLGQAYGDALDVAPAMHIAEAEYRRVRIRGRFENDKEFYLFTTGPGGGVYHVVTPLAVRGLWDFMRCSVCPVITPSGRAKLILGRKVMQQRNGVILVDRGYVPPALRDPKKRAAGLLQGPQEVIGILRASQQPGWFTPSLDFAHRIIFGRDMTSMTKLVGTKHIFPMMVEADATPNPGGWPKGGQTVVTFRNDHLQYAITWFALAAVVLGGWIAYHVSQGRIGRQRHSQA